MFALPLVQLKITINESYAFKYLLKSHTFQLLKLLMVAYENSSGFDFSRLLFICENILLCLNDNECNIREMTEDLEYLSDVRVRCDKVIALLRIFVDNSISLVDIKMINYGFDKEKKNKG